MKIRLDAAKKLPDYRALLYKEAHMWQFIITKIPILYGDQN